MSSRKDVSEGIIGGDFDPSEAGKAMMEKMGYKWAVTGVSAMMNDGGKGQMRVHLVLGNPFIKGNFSRQKGDAFCKTRDKFGKGMMWAELPSAHSLVACPQCFERCLRYGFELPDYISTPSSIGSATHEPLVFPYPHVGEEHLQEDEKNGPYIGGRHGGYIKFDGHLRRFSWVKNRCKCIHCGKPLLNVINSGVPVHASYHAGTYFYPRCRGGHMIVNGRDLTYKTEKVMVGVSNKFSLLEEEDLPF